MERAGSPRGEGARPGNRRSRRSRGQSLVEFAITAPIVLLMVLFGIDFGRVYLGWVTLNNAVREAANFAAINPNGFSPPNSGVVAEYERLLSTEHDSLNCTLPGSLPPPTFPSGRTIGSPAVVAVTCQFTLITPLIGAFLGNPLDVSASASFPIRSGSIAGTPGGGGGPLPSIGPVLPTPSPIPTPSPLVPPVDPTPTPEPMCTVPNLVQGNLKTDAAVGVWTANGFLANSLAFSPLVPPHFDIKDQSLSAGSSVLCSSSMTAYDKNQ